MTIEKPRREGIETEGVQLTDDESLVMRMFRRLLGERPQTETDTPRGPKANENMDNLE